MMFGVDRIDDVIEEDEREIAFLSHCQKDRQSHQCGAQSNAISTKHQKVLSF